MKATWLFVEDWNCTRLGPTNPLGVGAGVGEGAGVGLAACATSALIVRPSTAVSNVFLRFIGVITVRPIPIADWHLGGKCISSHTDYTVKYLKLLRFANSLPLAVASVAWPVTLRKSKRHLQELVVAAARWREQLQEAAALDCFSFEGLHREDGEPVKDLNDLLKIGTGSYRGNRERINTV